MWSEKVELAPSPSELAAWQEYLYSHMMWSEKVELAPSPSELAAWQEYSPEEFLLTLCSTRLWVLMMIPASGLGNSSTPCKSNNY